MKQKDELPKKKCLVSKTLLFLFTGLFAIAATAQAPTITGDLLLCPNTSGTAFTTTNIAYDTYQWYWKYWFTSDPYVAIPGADEESFTYDWSTYDQALLKLVVTLNGETYESNVLQIDSYAWVGLTMGYQDEPDDNVEFDPNSGNLMLCAGTSFTISVYMPYTVVQWYRNGIPIPGATSMDLHVTEAGSYHVVAAPGFCPNNTDSTAGLPIVVAIDNNCELGIENPETQALSFYPNPVSGQLHFSAQSAVETLAVFNMTGQKILAFTPETEIGQADLSALATGMYIVEARTNGKIEQFKIIKN
jgi:hypothetical protein